MTVTTQQSFVIHEGNGIATIFPYTFRITEPYMPRVEIRDSATLETLSVLTPSQYTITGVSPTNYLGGNVIYNPPGGPLPTGQQLLLRRVVNYVQLLDLINQGGFYPETVEYALDMIVFQTQQLAEATARAVLGPVGQPGVEINGVGTTGQILIYNAAGDLIPSDVMPGLGDMVKSVYDPQGKNVDAFRFDSMGPDKLALSQIADAPTTTFLGRSAAGSGVRRDVLFSEAAGLSQTVAYGQAQALTPAQQGQALTNIGGESLAGFRNKLINGDFDVWQRGTSQTTHGYGSVDRWFNHKSSDATRTISQQSFTLGQTAVPGNPQYFLRCVITAGSGTANIVSVYQRVEGVKNSPGKKTFTVWARATTTGKFMSFEGTQDFGTGGSPSSPVTGIGVNKVALTTAWTKYSFTLDYPSIAGKTIGTDGSDGYRVAVWISAGSDNDARTNSLGVQTGTFEIAHASMVDGDATMEADPFPAENIADTWHSCRRYFERRLSSTYLAAGWCDTTTTFHGVLTFWPKRATPSLSASGDFQLGISGTDASFTGSSVSFTNSGGSVDTVRITATTTGLTAGQGGILYTVTGGVIDIDAEI